MIHCEIQNSIAVLRMEHGKVQAIDIELLTDLLRLLDALEEPSVRSVVLTGSGSVFSAGVDLFRVLEGGPQYVQDFVPVMSEAFERLFLFPKPMIAAVNGHAIAGGCILTCSCDYRIMAEGDGRIGVPELLVGVPFPTIPLEILRFRTPPQFLQEIVYTGATYLPEEALKRGLIDEVVPSGKLLERACQMADRFASIPAKSFRIVKQLLRQPSMRQAKASATEQEQVLEAWKDPEIHSVIRKYLDRTIGKKKTDQGGC